MKSIVQPTHQAIAGFFRRFCDRIVSTWLRWQIARIQRRIDRTERWIGLERETHADQLATLRHELCGLFDARLIATERERSFREARR